MCFLYHKSDCNFSFRFIRSFMSLGVCCLIASLTGCLNTGHALYVSPAGCDHAAGTRTAPFRTLHRAQEAARHLTAGMTGDVVVNIEAGDYRLDRPLKFTPADSGSNGFDVVYRSLDGPGKARILGSRVLSGWRPYRDGIWKVDLPEDTLFHSLYESGKRVYKARFPDRDNLPEFPVDEKAHTLYYMPIGKEHPDMLGISYPVLEHLIQFKGEAALIPLIRSAWLIPRQFPLYRIGPRMGSFLTGRRCLWIRFLKIFT